MSDSKCLHCEMVKLIEDAHPGGLDTEDAHAVLIALARIAGDILACADPAALNGFMEVVAIVRAAPTRVLAIREARTRH